MTSDHLLLIGHEICPYVQRVVIVLEEKGITYERKDIVLDDKPAWLGPLSPTRKVPVLVINGNRVLFEANVITEFLDETYPGSLHPDCQLEKANHRAWIEFGSDILGSIAQIIYRDKTEVSFHASIQNIQEKFAILEEQLAGTPYFASSTFQLIDAVYGIIFRYFEVLTSISLFDPFQSLIKLQRWRDHLAEHQSIQRAVPVNYNNLLVEFISKQESYASHVLAALDRKTATF
ncbi:glutathione S-transferase family protein [Kiloniella sp.]|uniref:glutathione S-transferase family protein n=1 Tax=Kiloniella sp. TaxID=1938587 RepID=UPI003B017D3A